MTNGVRPIAAAARTTLARYFIVTLAPAVSVALRDVARAEGPRARIAASFSIIAPPAHLGAQEVDVMIRRFSWLLIALVLFVGAVPLRASPPALLAGSANGIELCEQAVCGSAIFVAIFSGQAGFNPHVLGTIVVSVNHTPLPDAENPTPADLTGGVW